MINSSRHSTSVQH
ncbi:40S ribosomal protein S2, partial [Caerostris darwini]